MLMDSVHNQTTLVPDLVAEAHHRIANSLSAVAGLIHQEMTALREAEAPMATADVRRMLGELRGRIEAVSRLHRALSDIRPDGPIDISQYVQQIASELVDSLAAPGAVTLQFAGELNCHVSTDRTLYIGLIAVEIITNALKYAHPAGVSGVIAVRCWRTPVATMIEISDDGVGLPDGYDVTGPQGHGLGIVNALAKQIDGTVRFESSDLGLTCCLEIPNAR